jgi:type I restriction enzyme S subunit
VTGRYGTIGQVFLIKEDYWPLNTTLWVKDFHGNDPHFASYLLRTVDFQSCSDKSSVPGVNRNDLHRIPVLLPLLAEQKAIAAVLGALDDKIELNRRMNATLEAMARALFQSWFVDFDPVRRNLDFTRSRGERGEEEKKFQPASPPLRASASPRDPFDALFPEHFAHGENGLLPLGWRLASIEEICAINAWTLGKNDDLETLEYVEISEVSRGNIANIATYPRGEEPSRARRRLRHGDTVLSTVRPDRGAYFLAVNPPENRVASTGFAVLTPTKVPWSFLHAALTQPEVSDHLGQMADGGAYPAVRPEIIGAMQIALPNEPKILEAFHRTCAPLFEQAEANRTQSRTLATLRDTLLPKLLSGELSVAAATATMEANV